MAVVVTSTEWKALHPEAVRDHAERYLERRRRESEIGRLVVMTGPFWAMWNEWKWVVKGGD